ncbi:lantibiotic dehydratase C-terminal domain-containing protein [Kitasatospora sp. NPDC018058]|uniref:lantibiotic dehydratase C-terminal domain-containing protein n=1 Tax=Kitasatospora sp. NPDC018058 TaxID=3364025 RepID=UPI0037BF5446
MPPRPPSRDPRPEVRRPPGPREHHVSRRGRQRARAAAAPDPDVPRCVPSRGYAHEIGRARTKRRWVKPGSESDWGEHRVVRCGCASGPFARCDLRESQEPSPTRLARINESLVHMHCNRLFGVDPEAELRLTRAVHRRLRQVPTA